MTLDEILQAVKDLNDDELTQLQKVIDQRCREASRARAEALMKAIEPLRAGLTEEQLKELESAINVEYVEAVDEDTWPED